jgi:hypothetical protein
VKYIKNRGNAMDANVIADQPASELAAPAPTMEAVRLRNSLREMHALASRYLAITGGGRSDGTDAAAVKRAAALLGIEE